MNADRFALDTNILFYAADPTAGQKHATAMHLLRQTPRDRVLIPLQAAGELIYSVGRKRPSALPVARQIATELAQASRLAPATPEDMVEALTLQQSHLVPFWDAMMIATSRRLKCSYLLTEDLQDGRTFGTLTIRNPLTLTPADLQALLA